MSRHRAVAQTLAHPHIEVDALPGITELERLCGMVSTSPSTAERFLAEDRVLDPVMRYTLCAEASLRLGKPRAARTIAFCAVDYAMQMQPVDPGWLLPAVTVLTDASVLAGAPDAIASCHSLGVLAERFHDGYRMTVAAGLHAVAVYQQESCRGALTLLDRLHRYANSGTAAAIVAARDTIVGCCARRRQQHWPLATAPVFTAGGQVQPELIPAFWSDRLLRWPGIHDCSSSLVRSG